MKKLGLIVIALMFVTMGVLPGSAQVETTYFPTEGWLTSTPEAQGIDSAELAAYFDTWSQEAFNLDSLLVVRNGYIVAEAYAPPNQPTIKHNLFSASKSITSTLIGVLLQEGLLATIDTPILDIFTDRTIENVDARKEALTVRDLLTMGSGLECNDMEADQLGIPPTTGVMETTSDWLQFALDLPMAREPGEQWYYCNAGVHILSGIITEKTGMSALDYAAERLFQPLGITDYSWTDSPTGVSLGYSDLHITSRDMAKIGYLYLNQGQWADKQIIPADYAVDSLGSQINTPWDGTPYGYLWWRIDGINLSFALGHGGQYILVLPDKNLVVVATGGMTESIRVPTNGYPMFFASAGLPTAADPLPENPTAFSQLESTIEAIQNPAPLPVASLPTLAAQISGQSYFLLNPRLFISSDFFARFVNYHIVETLDVQTLSLAFDDSDEAVLTLTFADGEGWTIPVGLDGLYRVSEGRLGNVGAKGEWLGDTTFRLYIKHVGTAFLHRFDLDFIPGALNIISYEYTSGGAIAVQGVAMQ